jgi:hypothetical protein
LETSLRSPQSALENKPPVFSASPFVPSKKNAEERFRRKTRVSEPLVASVQAWGNVSGSSKLPRPSPWLPLNFSHEATKKRQNAGFRAALNFLPTLAPELRHRDKIEANLRLAEEKGGWLRYGLCPASNKNGGRRRCSSNSGRSASASGNGSGSSSRSSTNPAPIIPLT